MFRVYTIYFPKIILRYDIFYILISFKNMKYLLLYFSNIMEELVSNK